jgi:hypothetical protein
MIDASAFSGLSPPETPVPALSNEITYGVYGRSVSIGSIGQLPDGSWQSTSPWGGVKVHSGPTARWDASHALTLAYMRHIG